MPRIKEESGVQTVTVNTGTGEPQGDNTEDITFANPFDEVPVVVLSLNEALTSGKVMTYLAATSVTASGFTIDWESDENTKTTLDIGWSAREKRSQERY